MTEERRSWRPKHGLAALSEQLLNIRMDKSVDLRAGDWNTKTLSPEQKKYAALDAWTALKIAHCKKQFWLQEPRRLGFPSYVQDKPPELAREFTQV